jgi:hypothetical protein
MLRLCNVNIPALFPTVGQKVSFLYYVRKQQPKNCGLLMLIVVQCLHLMYRSIFSNILYSVQCLSLPYLSDLTPIGSQIQPLG